ncbi:MAG: glycoside hydrolase family 57 protein [Bacteroidales bacterium]|nr:glycoside hydrolase family 57 protein [Candidatus Physcousia equi]
MKTICLYFEIHQPVHLKRYRFFDIGADHYYYDDYENERAITETAERSYIPALKAMLEMTQTYGKYFKVSFSLSGVAIELLEDYAPEVIDLLQQLSQTGCVEFLAEPYSHGLSSIANEDVFRNEVERQSKKIKELFGQTPKVLRNSSLIYSDEIGNIAGQMGYKAMLAEGAKHVLGWKSPHFVYSCAANPKVSLLLRDYKLSDDISLRFNDSSWSEYPLMSDRYADWIAQLPQEEQVINIFMELCALGIFQPLSSNILEFLKALPAACKERGIEFATPSEIVGKTKAVAPMSMPEYVSWNDEERDTSCWLGNGMQREAFAKLYQEAGRIMACQDRRIKQDWDRIQASNNLRYMTTKPMSVNMIRGFYDSPYDAFTNYMNILGDFIKRVQNLFPIEVENDELNGLYTTIHNLGEEVAVKEKELARLKARLAKLEASNSTEKKPAAKKATAQKAEPAEKKAESAAEKPAEKKAEPAAEKPAAKKATTKKTTTKK